MHSQTGWYISAAHNLPGCNVLFAARGLDTNMAGYGHIKRMHRYNAASIPLYDAGFIGHMGHMSALRDEGRRYPRLFVVPHTYACFSISSAFPQ